MLCLEAIFTDGRHIIYKIEDNDLPRSLRDYLKKEKSYSRRTLSSLMRDERRVLIDGAPSKLSTYLTLPCTVEVILPEERNATELTAAALPVFVGTSVPTVIYEDSDIIIFDKPADMPTHRSHGHIGDTLADYAQASASSPYTFRAVCRLDRNTSGLVPVAKNSYCAARLNGAVKKEYIALVHGKITSNGRIDAPIRRNNDSNILREVGADGEPSLTEYVPTAIISASSDVRDEYTVVRVLPKTGRTHQIRVHMAHIGHPLVGDDLYGGRFELGMTRHALHCARIEFMHPVTGEKLTFESAPPTDMRRAISNEA